MGWMLPDGTGADASGGAAALLLCGTSLSNTVMTRGWPLAMGIGVGSAELPMLIVAPLGALLSG
jgi:hypothetical protein